MFNSWHIKKKLKSKLFFQRLITTFKQYTFRVNFLTLGSYYYKREQARSVKDINLICHKLNDVNSKLLTFNLSKAEKQLNVRFSWAKYSLDKDELTVILKVFERGTRYALKSAQFSWILSYIDVLLFVGEKERATTLCYYIKVNAQSNELLSSNPKWGQLLFRLGFELNKAIVNDEKIKNLFHINNEMTNVIEITQYQNDFSTFMTPALFIGIETKEQTESLIPCPAPTNYSILESIYVNNGIIFNKNGDYLLVDKASHPASGFVSGQWDLIYGAIENIEKVIVYTNSKQKKSIVHYDSAIVFHGRNSTNFFHWLIEYIPRLILIEGIRELAKIKVLIPDGLPIQFWEVLTLIGIEMDRLIIIPKNTIVRLNKAIIPSFVTSIYDDLDLDLMKRSGYLNIPLMHRYRTLITKKINISNNYPKRIFILRPGGARGLINEKQVVQKLAKLGIVAIEPSRLLYKQQAEIFMNAELIVGVAGAAFANLFLCNKGCNIVSLIAQGNDFYSIQPNLATIAEANHYYVQGTRPYQQNCYDDPVHYMHANFSIDAVELVKVINLVDAREVDIR